MFALQFKKSDRVKSLSLGGRGIKAAFLFLIVFSIFNSSIALDKQAEAEQKRALILQFFEAKPPRALVDASIDAIASSRYAPDDPARDEFVSRMQVAVDYDTIEQKTLTAMMDVFTLPELKAMADYYTSDAGRAAEAKAKDLREKIAPDLKEMLDRGVMDVVTSPSPAAGAVDTQ